MGFKVFPNVINSSIGSTVSIVSGRKPPLYYYNTLTTSIAMLVTKTEAKEHV